MSRDDPARLSEKGQTMIPTEQQQAEIAAITGRYEELKAAGQGRAPRALPPPTPRNGAPIADAAVKYLHACRENFLIEAARHGLSKRDIAPKAQQD
jgi:hypothetical protein